jgi:hypothetical protein
VIPRTLSATSLSVADACLARWWAEQFKRGRGFSTSTAADLGTTCHNALEMYVKTYVMGRGDDYKWDFSLLTDLFKMAYSETFNTADLSGPDFDAGIEMMSRWFMRTSFKGVNVLSCETKETILIPTSAGEIPLNFIWDRFDQIGEKDWKVVDYKSNVWGIRPDDLKKKIQARIYALVAAIKLKDQQPNRIWVEFDMLRHDPVGVVFKRDEIKATWDFIIATAERIIATDEKNVPETLNAECRFCVRKGDCNALTKNIEVGGIFSLSDKAMIDKRAQLEWQQSAAESLIKEIDAIALKEAEAQDIRTIESESNRLNIVVSSRRGVDPERVEMVVGSEKFLEYGGLKLTLGQLEKMMKDPEVTPEKRAQLKSLIHNNVGEPKIKVESKLAIEGVDA